MQGNNRLPGDLLGRWTRLVKRLEQIDSTDIAGVVSDGWLDIDWSDLAVLNAYLTEDATPVAEAEVTVGQPDWDLCPWAEWAVVQIETNGPIHFHWSYFEYEPQPATGKGDGHYYHRKGKWRKDSREIPLGQVDLESTLQRRPLAQQDSQREVGG